MEHNIILIKPDVERQQMFSSLVQRDLVLEGFRIVSVATRRLSRQEFEHGFISKGPEHLQYMTEGDLVAILYGGHSAIKFARMYKGVVRKSYPRTKLRNILHSTEPGNEYSRQLELFFEGLPADEYRQYSDQGVRFGAVSRAELDGTGLRHLNVVCEPSELAETLEEYGDAREVECFGVLVHRESAYEIVEYFSRFAAGAYPECKRVKALLVRDVGAYERIVRAALERHQVEAVVTYRPGLSLIETENLRTEAFANGLFCIGGSFGRDRPGSICCSKEMCEALELGV